MSLSNNTPSLKSIHSIATSISDLQTGQNHSSFGKEDEFSIGSTSSNDRNESTTCNLRFSLIIVILLSFSSSKGNSVDDGRFKI